MLQDVLAQFEIFVCIGMTLLVSAKNPLVIPSVILVLLLVGTKLTVGPLEFLMRFVLLLIHLILFWHNSV